MFRITKKIFNEKEKECFFCKENILDSEIYYQFLAKKEELIKKIEKTEEFVCLKCWKEKEHFMIRIFFIYFFKNNLNFDIKKFVKEKNKFKENSFSFYFYILEIFFSFENNLINLDKNNLNKIKITFNNDEDYRVLKKMYEELKDATERRDYEKINEQINNIDREKFKNIYNFSDNLDFSLIIFCPKCRSEIWWNKEKIFEKINYHNIIYNYNYNDSSNYRKFSNNNLICSNCYENDLHKHDDLVRKNWKEINDKCDEIKNKYICEILYLDENFFLYYLKFCFICHKKIRKKSFIKVEKFFFTLKKEFLEEKKIKLESKFDSCDCCLKCNFCGNNIDNITYCQYPNSEKNWKLFKQEYDNLLSFNLNNLSLPPNGPQEKNSFFVCNSCEDSHLINLFSVNTDNLNIKSYSSNDLPYPEEPFSIKEKSISSILDKYDEIDNIVDKKINNDKENPDGTIFDETISEEEIDKILDKKRKMSKKKIFFISLFFSLTISIFFILFFYIENIKKYIYKKKKLIEKKWKY